MGAGLCGQLHPALRLSRVWKMAAPESAGFGSARDLSHCCEFALVDLKCDGAMSDHVLDLPSASPLWLVVHLQTQAPTPFLSPSMGPPSFSIDELQFM
jgi:hypothetical protein